LEEEFPRIPTAAPQHFAAHHSKIITMINRAKIIIVSSCIEMIQLIRAEMIATKWLCEKCGQDFPTENLTT